MQSVDGSLLSSVVATDIVPNSNDVGRCRPRVVVQFNLSRRKLTQDALDSRFNGRMVRTVASNELLDDGSQRDTSQFPMWNQHTQCQVGLELAM